MAEYLITAPDGKKYRVSGSGTQEEALSAFQSQWQANETPRSRLMRENPGEYNPESPEFKAKYGPTSGMGTGQRLAAGAGKALTDLARGAGQAVGLVSREDVANSRAMDAPLMQTGAGRTGNVLGTIAGTLPTVAIPGANTLTGAALIGGGLGALQPSTSTKETLKNAAIGGVMAPAAMLATRGATAAVKGAKAAFIDPFTKAGQERIAAQALTQMAGGADEAAKAAANIRSGLTDVLPGVSPNTAELAQNAGLAQLERTLKNNPEFTQAFANRAGQNRNAVIGALDSIAGDTGQMAAAEATRSATARPLYDAVRNATVRGDAELGKLMARPSMASAWNRAMNLASEAGDVLPETPEVSGKALHYLKMAMDDLADNPAANGIAGNEARAIKGTRDAFLGWLEKNIPEYAQARSTYAELSRPINQMQIGQSLRDKLLPAMTDYGAQTRLRPQAFAQAMREGDATAAKAMGGNYGTMADIMAPDQMQILNQIGTQLGRRVNADELGRAVGSNTGQNLIGQNVLRQFLGPLGLPESFTERMVMSPLGQGMLGAPSKIAEKVTGTIGEPNVMRRLVEAGLDPKLAADILEKAAKSGSRKSLEAGRYVIPAVSGANAARQ